MSIIFNFRPTSSHYRSSVLNIGVRDQCSLGGAEVSCPNIFTIAARKSSGFARILQTFLPEIGYMKISRGGGGGVLQPQPQPRTPMFLNTTQVYRKNLGTLMCPYYLGEDCFGYVMPMSKTSRRSLRLPQSNMNILDIFCYFMVIL